MRHAAELAALVLLGGSIRLLGDGGSLAGDDNLGAGAYLVGLSHGHVVGFEQGGQGYAVAGGYLGEQDRKSVV